MVSLARARLAHAVEGELLRFIGWNDERLLLNRELLGEMLPFELFLGQSVAIHEEEKVE